MVSRGGGRSPGKERPCRLPLGAGAKPPDLKAPQHFRQEGMSLERDQQRADLIKEFKRFPTASKPNNTPASRKAIFIAARGLLTLDATFRGQSNKITCLKRML